METRKTMTADITIFFSSFIHSFNENYSKRKMPMEVDHYFKQFVLIRNQLVESLNRDESTRPIFEISQRFFIKEKFIEKEIEKSETFFTRIYSAYEITLKKLQSKLKKTLITSKLINSSQNLKEIDELITINKLDFDIRKKLADTDKKIYSYYWFQRFFRCFRPATLQKNLDDKKKYVKTISNLENKNIDIKKKTLLTLLNKQNLQLKEKIRKMEQESPQLKNRQLQYDLAILKQEEQSESENFYKSIGYKSFCLLFQAYEILISITNFLEKQVMLENKFTHLFNFFAVNSNQFSDLIADFYCVACDDLTIRDAHKKFLSLSESNKNIIVKNDKLATEVIENLLPKLTENQPETIHNYR